MPRAAATAFAELNKIIGCLKVAGSEQPAQLVKAGRHGASASRPPVLQIGKRRHVPRIGRTQFSFRLAPGRVEVELSCRKSPVGGALLGFTQFWHRMGIDKVRR